MTPAVGVRGASRTRRRRLALGVAALLLTTLASASPILLRWVDDPRDRAPVVTDEIAIVGTAFDPPAVRVARGTTVTWRFGGGDEHNVVFDDGPASPILERGTWAREFASPGEYRYRCTLHAFMDGRVVVE